MLTREQRGIVIAGQQENNANRGNNYGVNADGARAVSAVEVANLVIAQLQRHYQQPQPHYQQPQQPQFRGLPPLNPTNAVGRPAGLGIGGTMSQRGQGNQNGVNGHYDRNGVWHN
jgi:hypothetical protein